MIKLLKLFVINWGYFELVWVKANKAVCWYFESEEESKFVNNSI